MPSNVTGDFSATGGVAHVDSVLQVKLFSEGCEIVGVGVHVVAIPRLGGTTVPSPVMRDDSIALLTEEQHLSVPVVRSERPAVTEHYGLALAPILVVNLRAVFCGERRHKGFSLVVLSVRVFACRYRGFRQREPNLKTCVTRLRIDLNITPVFFHDPLHRVEAQSSSLPYSLGCEERFKDVCLNLGRNAWTVIANLHHDATVVLIGSYPKLAFSAHCIDGVIDDIGPYLIELAAK